MNHELLLVYLLVLGAVVALVRRLRALVGELDKPRCSACPHCRPRRQR